MKKKTLEEYQQKINELYTEIEREYIDYITFRPREVIGVINDWIDVVKCSYDKRCVNCIDCVADNRYSRDGTFIEMVYVCNKHKHIINNIVSIHSACDDFKLNKDVGDWLDE